MKASITIHAIADDHVAIIDNDDRMSITNDEEAVVKELYEEGILHHQRLIYQDTNGYWDELTHNGSGGFMYFNFLNKKTYEEAVDKIRGLIE